jgi:hypothetical protein
MDLRQTTGLAQAEIEDRTAADPGELGPRCAGQPGLSGGGHPPRRAVLRRPQSRMLNRCHLLAASGAYRSRRS